MHFLSPASDEEWQMPFHLTVAVAEPYRGSVGLNDTPVSVYHQQQQRHAGQDGGEFTLALAQIVLGFLASDDVLLEFQIELLERRGTLRHLALKLALVVRKFRLAFLPCSDFPDEFPVLPPQTRGKIAEEHCHQKEYHQYRGITDACEVCKLVKGRHEEEVKCQDTENRNQNSGAEAKEDSRWNYCQEIENGHIRRDDIRLGQV